jgi:type III secretion system needle length determinant
MKVLQSLESKVPNAGKLQPDVTNLELNDVEALSQKLAELLGNGMIDEGKPDQSGFGEVEGNLEPSRDLTENPSAQQDIVRRVIDKEVSLKGNSPLSQIDTAEGEVFPEKPPLGDRTGHQIIYKDIHSKEQTQPSQGGLPGDETLGLNFATQRIGEKGEKLQKEEFIQPQIEGSKHEKLSDTKDDVVDAIISQMSQFSTNIGVGASPPATHQVQAQTSAEPIPEHVRKMVERILVEVPGTSHKQEVRIRLNQDVLADTDIRIFREAGRLEIQFVTGSRESHDFLSPNLTSLKEALENRQGEPVSVSVQYTGEGASDQNQGRSRQRRAVWDEYENV